MKFLPIARQFLDFDNSYIIHMARKISIGIFCGLLHTAVQMFCSLCSCFLQCIKQLSAPPLCALIKWPILMLPIPVILQIFFKSISSVIGTLDICIGREI